MRYMNEERYEKLERVIDECQNILGESKTRHVHVCVCVSVFFCNPVW